MNRIKNFTTSIEKEKYREGEGESEREQQQQQKRNNIKRATRRTHGRRHRIRIYKL